MLILLPPSYHSGLTKQNAQIIFSKRHSHIQDHMEIKPKTLQKNNANKNQKLIFEFISVYLTAAALALTPGLLYSQQPSFLAMIAGQDGGGASSTAYASSVNFWTNIAGPNLTGLPTSGGSALYGVAVNNLGQAIVGGQADVIPNAYAAFVDIETNTVNAPIFNLIQFGALTVSINDSEAFIGGVGLVPFRNAYAAFVDIQTNTAGPPVTGVPAPNGNTFLNAVAINNAQQVLIAGAASNVPYAATVDVTTNAVSAVIANVPSSSGNALYNCAINQSGLGLIVGYDTDTHSAYAAFIPPNSTTALPNLLPVSITSTVWSAALNDLNEALIGSDNGFVGYVYFATQIVTPISNVPAGASIYAAAINDFGQGLIGGVDGSSPYAAFVDLNTMRAGDPIQNLPLNAGSAIYSAVLRGRLTIPTNTLFGNNRIFANYINMNAPQLFFYFFPAILSGNLTDALEKAAPTRNAISLFVADNNLFYLSHCLSKHLRNHRHFQEHIMHKSVRTTASLGNIHHESDRFMASLNNSAFFFGNI